MLNVLHKNSEITTGRYKGKTVNEVLEKDKKEIFYLIKKGVSFDDEVLSMSGITKKTSNVRFSQVFVEHAKDNKIYEKDTASLSKILKELRTIDNLNETEI